MFKNSNYLVNSVKLALLNLKERTFYYDINKAILFCGFLSAKTIVSVVQ